MDTPLKTCYSCQQTKPEELFKKNYRNKQVTGYSNQCLDCNKRIYREWRTKNAERYNRQFRERRAARKNRGIEYKGGKCEDCGQIVHLAAFDFHHLDPSQKEKDVGLMMNLSDPKFFAELDKCILLCSNCHRIRHYNG